MNPLVTKALESSTNVETAWRLVLVLAKSGNRRAKVWEEIKARAPRAVRLLVETRLKEMGRSV